jgi:nucleotide-binding universal stress UspA family protein
VGLVGQEFCTMRALIAVDGSSNATDVLDAVSPWLKASNASVELMTVLDLSEIHNSNASQANPMPTTPLTGGPAGLEVREEESMPSVTEDRGQAIAATEDAARDRLREFALKHLGGIDCAIHISTTNAAAEAIVEEAARWQADAIAMGTHGRTGIARALMGSVAERVLRESHVPVFLVRNVEG